MIYLQLFLEFLKIGLFTVGGGLASLPFLYELSDKYGWFTYADLTNMIAISESTPGPIGINAATYVGFHVAGVLGSVIATLATMVPAFFFVTFVASILDKFKQNRLVQNAFTGIRPAVTALITVAFWAVFSISVMNVDLFAATGRFSDLINPTAAILFAVALFLILKFKKHPLWYILGGAVVGIFIAP